jgi:hypothetical protein
MVMRFKDGPEPAQPGMVPPGAENKIMHAALKIGDATVLMSDGRCLGQPNFQGFALSLTVAGRGRSPVCGAGPRRASADATGPDVLLAALRHGGRSLWRVLDGVRRDLKRGRRGEPDRFAASANVMPRNCWGWRAWRRPTLPPLERQYHRRRGFSLPSSGWDRVLCPSPWPPGRPAPFEPPWSTPVG